MLIRATEIRMFDGCFKNNRNNILLKKTENAFSTSEIE